MSSFIDHLHMLHFPMLLCPLCHPFCHPLSPLRLQPSNHLTQLTRLPPSSNREWWTPARWWSATSRSEISRTSSEISSRTPECRERTSTFWLRNWIVLVTIFRSLDRFQAVPTGPLSTHLDSSSTKVCSKQLLSSVCRLHVFASIVWSSHAESFSRNRSSYFCVPFRA